MQRAFKQFFQYFFPAAIDVSLARWVGLMFTNRKNILFYVEFSSLPFRSGVNSFRSLIIYKLLHTYMPQCLLICNLTQLQSHTSCIHVRCCSTAVQIKKVPGHQVKCTFVLGLVLKRDRHNETKGQLPAPLTKRFQSNYGFLNTAGLNLHL